MKIILLQDIRGIGRKGDVKNVPDGYARNMLFPNKLAEQATEGALKKIETKKIASEHEEAELKKHLASIARELKDVGLEFELATGKDGSVFGSIGKETILKAIRDHKLVTTERVEIIMDHPIKTLGEHVIALDFKKGITAKLKIMVVAKKS